METNPKFAVMQNNREGFLTDKEGGRVHRNSFRHGSVCTLDLQVP